MKLSMMMLLILGPRAVLANDVTDLDASLAEDYALYAMMASNAYLDSGNRTYFPIEELGWVRVDLDGQPTDVNSYSPTSKLGKIASNLQFDIWEHQTEPKTVISFKGTDEPIDWLVGNLAIGVSVPYKSAKKRVKRYVRSNPQRAVTMTGHSLGGGIALSVSVWEGIDAIVFDSSPRIFDGFWNRNKMAERKAIYQRGEILEKLRKYYPKFINKIPARDIVRTSFDFGDGNDHRADLLAEGILRCATENPRFAALASKITPKVACNFSTSSTQ